MPRCALLRNDCRDMDCQPSHASAYPDCQDEDGHAAPALPCRAVRDKAYRDCRELTSFAAPRLASPGLNCRAMHTSQNQAMHREIEYDCIVLLRLAKTRFALPHLACIAQPCRANHAVPCLDCHDLPNRAVPNRAKPRIDYQVLRPDLPCPVAPRLARPGCAQPSPASTATTHAIATDKLANYARV